MPYPNEHAARVRSPSVFKEDGITLDDGSKSKFARKEITKGLAIIVGKLKNPLKGKEDSTVTQAYRFNKDQFTEAQAQKWLKDKKIKVMSFEAAKAEKKKD